MSMRIVASAACVLALALSACGGAGAGLPTPASAVDELIAADRAYSAASARTDLVSGISAMFADDVIMPIPRNGFANGKAAAVGVLRSTADNAKSKATWSPIRAGISADGTHGFTYGYMVTEKPDKSVLPGKYLAYWIKGASGWRVAVYKRAPRPAGEVSTEMRPPSLPTAMANPVTDPAVIMAHRQSVADAERAFSAEAQRIGLGPAFVINGAPDAMNMGGAASFTFGPEAIGRAVSEGEPASGSSVSWSADRSLAASSGDLGVTIGEIRLNDPPAGQAPPRFPFFTIWRRASLAAPWRYVAE
jgi:ketosteroid isomerase-like protein